jgi:thioredoxin-related protein
MRNLLILCALFIFVAIGLFKMTKVHAGAKLAGPAFATYASGTWLTDFPAAKQQAAFENKKLLLDFSNSEACYPCQRLNSEVWETGEFRSFASDYILVRLEFPHDTKLPPDLEKQNYELGQQFSVTNFPTVIVLDSSGREITRQTGYELGSGPRAYLAQFK